MSVRDLKKIIGDSETGGVTRLLEVEGRSWAMPVFQQQKKVLDSELNLVAQLALTHAAWHERGSRRESGFLRIGDTPTLDTGAEEVTFQSSATIPMFALVRGMLLEVTDPVTSYPDLVVEVDLSGLTTVLVMLEVFFEEIEPTSATEGAEEIVARYGNDGDLTGFTNDLEDPGLGIETTRRVQARYILRAIEAVDFSTYPEGIDDATHVQSARNASYTFTADAVEAGLYYAGDGSVAAATALGTVDGYTYAIPMAKLSYDATRLLWETTDLRHNLEPLHKVDQWDRYEALWRAISAATDATYGVYRFSGELLVHNLHIVSTTWCVDVDAGVALAGGHPYHQAAEETNFEIGPTPSGTDRRAYTVAVEYNRRSRRCDLVAIPGVTTGSGTPTPPTPLNNTWVTQIPLAYVRLYADGLGISNTLEDARNYLALSGYYDDIYIRQDGGEAENAWVTHTLGGINTGAGIGVKGSSDSGPGLKGESISGYGLVVAGPALVPRLGPTYLGNRAYYDMQECGWVMGTGVYFLGTCTGGRYIYGVKPASNLLCQFNPETYQQVTTATTGTYPVACAFDGQYIWVLNQGGEGTGTPTVTKIRAYDMSVIGNYGLGFGSGMSAVDIAFCGQYIWCSLLGAGYNTNIVRVTPSSGSATTILQLATDCYREITPVQGKIWIWEKGDYVLRRYSKAGSLELTAYANASLGIRGVAFDGVNLLIFEGDVTGPDMGFHAISVDDGAAEQLLLPSITMQFSSQETVFDGWRLWMAYREGGTYYAQAFDVARRALIAGSKRTFSGPASNNVELRLDHNGGVWVIESTNGQFERVY